jgi:hypothetical protein
MIHNEVFLAGGYAVVLAIIGRGFDWMAAQRERQAMATPTGTDVAGEDAESKVDPSFAHLEAARFHRGLAMVVCFCAILILFIVALRHPALSSIGILCIAACAPGWMTFRIGKRFIGFVLRRK